MLCSLSGRDVPTGEAVPGDGREVGGHERLLQQLDRAAGVLGPQALGFGDGRLRLLPLVDVHADADHRPRVTVVAVDDPPASLEPVDLTVGPHDPVLVPQVITRAQGLLDPLPGGEHVVRVDESRNASKVPGNEPGARPYRASIASSQVTRPTRRPRPTCPCPRLRTRAAGARRRASGATRIARSVRKRRSSTHPRREDAAERRVRRVRSYRPRRCRRTTPAPVGRTSHWRSSGASAALLGLVFVGLSINLKDVIGSRQLVNRPLEAVVALGSVLVRRPRC